MIVTEKESRGYRYYDPAGGMDVLNSCFEAGLSSRLRFNGNVKSGAVVLLHAVSHAWSGGSKIGTGLRKAWSVDGVRLWEKRLQRNMAEAVYSAIAKQSVRWVSGGKLKAEGAGETVYKVIEFAITVRGLYGVREDIWKGIRFFSRSIQRRGLFNALFGNIRESSLLFRYRHMPLRCIFMRTTLGRVVFDTAARFSYWSMGTLSGLRSLWCHVRNHYFFH